jgi:uncharacterized protein (DUF1800 family)
MASARDVASIRFGYGLRPGLPAPAGPEDLLEGLARARPVPPEMAGIASASRLDELAELRRRRGDAEARQQHAQRTQARLVADQHARVAAAVLTPDGFFERLAAFWADHFTVSAANRTVADLAAPFEVEAVRPHVRGRFYELLVAAMSHPGMLLYLDQAQSIGPNSLAARRRQRGGLNENLARELLELHTLGVDGGYGQADVAECARLLTGWSVRPQDGRFVFEPRIAEPGAKRVMGRSYGGARPDVADAAKALVDLARHPATVRHISTKLARHFVADEPPASLVAALEAAWHKSDGELMAVYRALATRPEAWAGFGAKVKPPFDFVVSGLRALGVGPRWLAPRAANRMGRGAAGLNPATVGALHVLNQPVYLAPGPDGWPDRAEAWITPQGLSARLEWAAGIAAVAPVPDPDAFLAAALGEAASANTARVVTAAGSREEAVALVLASPEFNRR